jgi:phosphoribosylformylglycinamidine cyclo-ligase
MSNEKQSGGAYQRAGVDIDAQDAALDRIKGLVASTRTAGVLSELGSFGGLFSLSESRASEPILVASADGVGTKLMVARMAGDYSTVGQDLVNHCVNDILVQGAEPLFFMDYVGAGVLEPEAVVDLVKGVTAGCRENGCALLGGETAEMPGFYAPGDYELVGFVVGLVDRPKLLDGSRVKPGDRLIGLRSSGLHTNGYSLARRIFFDELGLGVDDPIPGLDDGRSVGRHLLDVHRSYLPALREHIGDPAVHGLAHITGGGLTDNLPRLLPEGTRAVIDTGAWEVPPIFRVMEEKGGVSRPEMLRVFNMGIGMVVLAEAEEASRLVGELQEKGEEPVLLGSIEERPGEGPPDRVVYTGSGGGA